MKCNRLNQLTKIAFLCCVLSLGCFGAEAETNLRVSQKTIQPDWGWFFGIGLGGGIERFKAITSSKNEIMSQNFASLVASAKIGIYQSLNEKIGLRYYYSFDLSFNPGDPNRSALFSQFYQEQGAYTSFKYHMLNVDALFNAYTLEKMDFGIIAGVGIGVTNGVYAERLNSTYFVIKQGILLTDWDMRLNLGARILFDKKYGIELLAKIPLTSTVINHNLETNNDLIRKGSAYFTLDYVMQF